MAARFIVFFVMLWTQVLELLDLLRSFQGEAPTPLPHRRRVGFAGLEELEGRELLTYDLLGAAAAVAPLPAGYDYQHIESSAVGNGHGAPYVIGQSHSNPNQSALFIGTETANGVTWGAPIWLPTVGANPANPRVFASDLVRDPNGSPIILGSSRLNTGIQATSWRLDSSGTALIPTLHTNPSGEVVLSYLTGGDSLGNFAGVVSASGRYNSGTNLLDLPTDGLAFDRYGNTIVGSSFWTQDTGGNWVANTPQLPAWADPLAFNIYEVSSNVMGGYVYNPNLDEILPAIWANDGSLISTFDLAGYQVSEIIDDHGVNMALLNDPNLFGPSYLWAEGWANPRLVYGDLLPGLLPGMNGTVIDFSSGGSQWLLTRTTDGNGNTVYDVANANVSAVPEPQTWVLMALGFLGLFVFHRHREGALI